MTNITDLFNKVFLPVKGLLVFSSAGNDHQYFIEAYDINEKGKMINAHPLSADETQTLANCLSASLQNEHAFLQSLGLIPASLLYIRSGKDGFAIWQSKPQYRNLFFHNDLGIPDGKFAIPSLVWKADKQHLSVFAIKDTNRPSINTRLYHAPWFNIYESGSVCMGNVDISIGDNCALEDFITQWEHYFFESKFSHVIGTRSPVSGNLIQLWNGLHNTSEKFPSDQLCKTNLTIKSLIA